MHKNGYNGRSIDMGSLIVHYLSTKFGVLIGHPVLTGVHGLK